MHLIRRSIAAIAVAAFAISFLAVVPAMAVEDPGYGPDSALTPSEAWTSLAPGESRWYTFHYDYDQISNVETEVIIELQSQYEDAVRFEIWTPRTVQHWVNDDDTDTWNPVGAGTKLSEQTDNDVDDNTLIWASKASVSETYYVIVTNARDVVSNYELTISGVDVSFPGLESPRATAAAPAGTPKIVAMDAVVVGAEPVAAATVLAVNSGNGPSHATNDTGQPQSYELSISISGSSVSF